MTDRILTLVAAVMLAMTLAACSGTDNRQDAAQGDVPDSSITTQPEDDTRDTADGDVYDDSVLDESDSSTARQRNWALTTYLDALTAGA